MADMGGAEAMVKLADGTDAGTVTLMETASGALQVTLNLMGLPEGVRAVHIHETGKCDAPMFETAGPHLAGGKEHGAHAAGGMHQGDLPNITVGADGKAMAEFFKDDVKLADIMDADGSAFVVHDKLDDYMTQPSGDAGDRIACGVFEEKS